VYASLHDLLSEVYFHIKLSYSSLEQLLHLKGKGLCNYWDKHFIKIKSQPWRSVCVASNYISYECRRLLLFDTI